MTACIIFQRWDLTLLTMPTFQYLMFHGVDKKITTDQVSVTVLSNFNVEMFAGSIRKVEKQHRVSPQRC